MSTSQQTMGRSPQTVDRQSQATASDTAPRFITLHILSTREKVSIPLKSKAVLGRLSETDAEGTLHIDLTPYYGYQLGVSRRHVMLVYDNQQRLMALDLASHNGTLLNGQKMSSHTGYIIHDGDELTLGSLTIRIHYSDQIPFSEKPTSYSLLAQPQAAVTPPAALAYPTPDIRETLETRPLRSTILEDSEILEDQDAEL